MPSWFVSTIRAVGDEVEWLLTPCETEDQAKACAARSLARGLRVEAGTLPGVEPRAHRLARRAPLGPIVERGLDHEHAPTPRRVCRLRRGLYKARRGREARMR